MNDMTNNFPGSAVERRFTHVDQTQAELFEPLAYCTFPTPEKRDTKRYPVAKGPSWVLALIAFVVLIGGLMEIESTQVTIKGADTLKCPLLAVIDSEIEVMFEQRCYWMSGTDTP